MLAAMTVTPESMARTRSCVKGAQRLCVPCWGVVVDGKTLARRARTGRVFSGRLRRLVPLQGQDAA